VLEHLMVRNAREAISPGPFLLLLETRGIEPLTPALQMWNRAWGEPPALVADGP
jgi:hypothetical protein